MKDEIPLAAIMDDEDALVADAAHEYREAAKRATEFFRSWAMAVKGFKGQRAFAFDCGLLALGWFDILGCATQVELANRWKCEKENVRKLVSHIQNLTGAPPTANQRGQDGKNAMRESRLQNRKGRKQP